MDKLDIILSLLEEAIEDSNWGKVEEAHNILIAQYEDPYSDYNMDDIPNGGAGFDTDDNYRED
jgi:hypothetical protein